VPGDEHDNAAEITSSTPAEPALEEHSRWDRAAPLFVTGFAVVMFGWNVQRNEWSNGYYSAAVRSMGMSWHAFWYASVDSGGWVTVDKPPLSLWLSSLSTRLFGFHPWALMLPTVLLGGASVWLLMSTVRRVAGRAAGLVSGVLLALTPMMVALSRSNLPDVPLTFFVVLAGWAAVRGYSSTAWRWPILIGIAAAAGFLTKSVAVGLALPGIGIGYLIAAEGRWPQRVARAGAAAAVFAGLVGLWLLSVDARSLSTRPWIGGSKDGSAWGLVFGYNFSVFGGEGGLPPGFGRGPGPLAGLFMEFGGERGVGRMFNSGMGDQVMWWFPMAVFGVIAALAGRSRWKQRDPLVGATVMWTLWALASMCVFSFTRGVLHPYYVVEFAPALAALAGIGAVRAWQAGDWRWRIAGGSAIVATAAVQLVLLRRNASYSWMRPMLIVAVAVVAVAGVIVLFGRHLFHFRSAQVWRWSTAAVGISLLVAPFVWSLSAVRHTVGGLFPAARPGTDLFASGPPTNDSPYGAADFTEDTLRWLDAQRTTETWTIAMPSAMVAEDALIEGHRVVAIGGFSGGDGAASAARVADAVAAGRLRFFLAGGGRFDLQEPDVFAVVRSVCTRVPSSAWGGNGLSGVYDCQGKANALLGPAS
jgi:4-amino-4-deoxy-L-arabinose transferase-like glycosyltransferase